MITLDVKTLSARRGIENANQLAVKADLPPSVAWKLWNDSMVHVNKETLDTLCTFFAVQPGKLLKHVKEE